MTPAELQRLRELCERATPGPWEVFYGHTWVLSTSTEDSVCSSVRDRDAAFIAAARETVPALIAEVERLQAVADRATTIADEAFGLAPVESPEESLTRIESGIFLAVHVLPAVACTTFDFDLQRVLADAITGEGTFNEVLLRLIPDINFLFTVFDLLGLG